MIAKLLAFNNLFAAKGSFGTLPSKSASTQNNSKFAAVLPEQTQQSEAPEITTPYNESVVVQNKPSENTSNFDVKKITSQPTQKALGEQLDEQDISSDCVSRIPSINPVLAQLLAAANLGKGQEVLAALVQPQTSQKSALLKSNLPANGNPIPALLKDNLPADGSPISALLKDNLPANGSPVSALLKSVLPANDSQESVSIKDNLPKSAANQSQVGQQLLSPEAVTKISNPDSLPVEGEAALEIQMTGEAPIVETKPPNLSLPKELMPQAANTNKNGEKVTAPNEKPDTADKPPVLSNEKILIPENNISDIEQNVSAEPQKPLFNTEKPIDNKISGQYRHPSQNGFAESANGGQEQGGNLSDWLPGQKPSQTQVKVSIEQITDQSSSSNNGQQPNFEQMLVANNAQTAVKEQLPPAAKTAKNAQSLQNTSVSEQIQGSIQGSLRQGDQQITIRLNPPELGKVTIKFHEQQDQLTGLLQVSKTQTKYEIQQALPEIIQNLQNMGIQVKKLEVVMSEPDLTGQQAYNNQSLQDGSAGHQAGTHENTPGGTVTAYEWLTNGSGYSQTPQSQQDTQITDKSINMLM